MMSSLNGFTMKKTADAQEVIEYLTSVMRGKHKDQTLKLIGDGVQKIVDINVPAKDRIKAAELLGKRYGLFNSDKDQEKPIQITFVKASEKNDSG